MSSGDNLADVAYPLFGLEAAIVFWTWGGWVPTIRRYYNTGDKDTECPAILYSHDFDLIAYPGLFI